MTSAKVLVVHCCNMHVIAIIQLTFTFLTVFEVHCVQGARFVKHGHLDYVARRLSIHECRKLSEALHMKHVELDHPVDGSLEPHLHCLELLRHWNTHEGKKQLVTALELRLGQIGRQDVADELDNEITKEVENALSRVVFNDTFLTRTAVYKEDKEEMESEKDLLKDIEKESGEEPEGSPDPQKEGLSAFAIATIIFVPMSIAGSVVALILLNLKGGPPKCKSCKRYFKKVEKNYYKEVKGKVPYHIEESDTDQEI